VSQAPRPVPRGQAAADARPWCVIPAAGRASRLGGQTAGRSKTLMLIEGQTLLERLLEGLAPEIAGACVVLGPETGSLPASARFDLPVRSVVQPEPRGVADAIARAEGHVDGPFVVVMGDTFYERPLAPYVARWRRSGLAGAVLVEKVIDRPSEPAGFVEVRGREVGAIWKGAPTPDDPSLRRVAGMLILPHAAFRACQDVAPADATGELEVEDLTRLLLAEGYRFLALPYRGWRRNINTPRDVRRVEAHLGSATRERSVSCT
jgi:dTDP-glucose pyrophosphorylase